MKPKILCYCDKCQNMTEIFVLHKYQKPDIVIKIIAGFGFIIEI